VNPYRALVPAVVAVLSIAGCDHARTPVEPAPPPGPTLIEQSGPVAIVFAEAIPPPGTTVRGCGPLLSGCVNRVVMRFSLQAQDAGHILGVRAFLHATNRRACLVAQTGPFDLGSGETRPLSLVFDHAEDCGVPLTIATMAVVVEGTVEVASRRAWSVTYTFEP
jgi:hypothetical protein